MKFVNIYIFLFFYYSHNSNYYNFARSLSFVKLLWHTILYIYNFKQINKWKFNFLNCEGKMSLKYYLSIAENFYFANKECSEFLYANLKINNFNDHLFHETRQLRSVGKIHSILSLSSRRMRSWSGISFDLTVVRNSCLVYSRQIVKKSSTKKLWGKWVNWAFWAVLWRVMVQLFPL